VTEASAFLGLLNPDLRVLRRSLGQFAAQIVLQPLLLVFTFTYVLPHIGLGFSAEQLRHAARSRLCSRGQHLAPADADTAGRRGCELPDAGGDIGVQVANPHAH